MGSRGARSSVKSSINRNEDKIEVSNSTTNKIPQKVIDNFLNNAVEGNYYISTISPDNFLKITSSEKDIKEIESDVNSGRYGEFDINKLNEGYITLQVDLRDGKVLNHEGRHRMQMLKNNGYKESEIIVQSLEGTYFDDENPNKQFKHDFGSLHLKSQSRKSKYETTITDLKYLNKKG